jgi:hypothetical protein
MELYMYHVFYHKLKTMQEYPQINGAQLLNHRLFRQVQMSKSLDADSLSTSISGHHCVRILRTRTDNSEALTKLSHESQQFSAPVKLPFQCYLWSVLSNIVHIFTCSMCDYRRSLDWWIYLLTTYKTIRNYKQLQRHCCSSHFTNHYSTC